MNKEQFFDALMNNKRLITRDGRRVELTSYDNQAAKPFGGSIDFGNRAVNHWWLSNGHIISDEESHDFDIVGFYVDPPALTTEQMFDALMNRKPVRTRSGEKVILTEARDDTDMFTFVGEVVSEGADYFWDDGGCFWSSGQPSSRDIIGYWED